MSRPEARRFRDSVGDLAIVLHSHMPYVEGFGTYPFGEEWLFDAIARSYLPVLESAEDLTVTVTPVLADQLEADGVGERALEFIRRHRLAAAERDAAEAEQPLRAAAAADAEGYARAIGRLEELGGNALRAFQEANGRVELMASAATHAVLPKLATLAGRRLQVDAGLRSHRRRFGAPQGFWLPECAYVPGTDAVLAERGLSYTCLDLSAREPDGAALAPARLPSGLTGVHDRLAGGGAGLVAGRVPLRSRLSRVPPALAQRDPPLEHSAASHTTAGRRASARPSTRAISCERVRSRLARHAESGEGRGLCVFAIDTELLGHWWAEGPSWLAEVLAAAAGEGVRLLKLTEALAEHEPQAQAGRRVELGRGQGAGDVGQPRRGGPRLGLAPPGAAHAGARCARARWGEARRGPCAPPASCSPCSPATGRSWTIAARPATIPSRRATDHAQAMLEAIIEAQGADPRLRNLAPDLSLGPLLEP